MQFLIHKPASVVQIARCLQAAHAAVIVKRRKQHREPVRIAANLHSRSAPLLGALIVNLGSEGAGLKLNITGCRMSGRLSAGDELDLSFISPEREARAGQWRGGVGEFQGNAGVKFEYIPTAEKAKLEQWLAGRFDVAVKALR